MVVLAAAPVALRADVVGPARVIDGDTLELAGRRVRLSGIDAPERHQSCQIVGTTYPCGSLASAWLARRTHGEAVRCAGKARDRYGRLLAVCFVGRNNLNEALVRAGWALAFRRYSDAFIASETIAKEAGRGLWAGSFVPPWQWRRGRRLAAPTIDPGCPVKGNVSAGGRRIYHLPGGRYYAELRLRAGEGDRCFRSEAAAAAAGFRASRR